MNTNTNTNDSIEVLKIKLHDAKKNAAEKAKADRKAVRDAKKTERETARAARKAERAAKKLAAKKETYEQLKAKLLALGVDPSEIPPFQADVTDEENADTDESDENNAANDRAA